jgi:hypothetical protein
MVNGNTIKVSSSDGPKWPLFLNGVDVFKNFCVLNCLETGGMWQKRQKRGYHLNSAIVAMNRIPPKLDHALGRQDNKYMLVGKD